MLPSYHSNDATIDIKTISFHFLLALAMSTREMVDSDVPPHLQKLEHQQLSSKHYLNTAPY